MPSPAKTSVTVLLSGSGSTFSAITDFSRRDDAGFQVNKVISDNANAFGLKRAHDAGVPTDVVDYRQFETRADAEDQLLRMCSKDKPDLVVLAGFMRIVNPQFVAAFKDRLLNIHPSLLPAYPGLNTYARAMAAGDTRHGSTVHFVSNVLDGGPLISQAVVTIENNDTVDSLSARVQAAERILYPRVINWIAHNELRCEGDAVYYQGRLLRSPKPFSFDVNGEEIDHEA